MGEPAHTGAAGGPRRTAVVTGASAGIGRAFAERLARDHMDLCLVARRRDRLEALAGELAERRGVAVAVRAIDLTDRDALDGLIAWLGDDPPDLLVNNAGFGTVGPFVDLDDATEEREILLNALVPVRLARAVLGPMVKRGHGGVINVSSLAGLGPSPYTATYAATKAFLTVWSEGVAEELRGTGVRVQALLPGFTRTEFQEVAGVEPSKIPDAAWMEPEAVVEASLAALSRGDVRCVPGLGNRVLAAAQGLVPASLKRRIMALAMQRRLSP